MLGNYYAGPIMCGLICLGPVCVFHYFIINGELRVFTRTPSCFNHMHVAHTSIFIYTDPNAFILIRVRSFVSVADPLYFQGQQEPRGN